MTDPVPKDAMESTIDAEMAEILERYLEDQADGTALPREAWLAQHPKFAGRLSACLDGVELFGDALIGGELLGRNHPPVEDKMLPESIGDYEILGELGRGGMGVVYEAREKSLDRIVALKVMRFGIVDPRALERFQREAETAGALHHTNIVPVYAVGRQRDTSWYAMQRIEGESLAHRISRAYQSEKDQIPLAEILNVGIQAAEALDHAHQRDVVHRDVKPANLIIDGEGRVWLTDFGLARRLVDVGATMTGAILGTPRYMSPEQADLRGTEVDHRTDIYSLGATLYEMSTGRPPFEGDDPLKVISQIRYEEPSAVRNARADLPRDLDVVLSKCLEKESDRRYGSAAELAEDLRAIRDDRAIRARAVMPIERAARWARKHGARVRLAGLAVFATAATLLLAVLAVQSWQESNLASFRLRAAGGPYMTSIHPVGKSNLSEDAIELTVPMQSYQKLKIGDYDMMLAPRGRWSRELRLPIYAGMPTDFRLRNEPTQSREVLIEDAYAVPVAGFKEPAVLVSQDGRLSRTTLSGDHDWALDISDVTVTLTALDEKSQSDTATSQVNFANTKSILNTALPKAALADAAKTRVASKALTTAIDLDGDAKADSLVAAMDKSALMAINANGEVLWARGYEFGGVSLDGNPNLLLAGASVPLRPGFVSLVDIGDRDHDVIHDVAAMVAQFRDPPAGPNVRFLQIPFVQTEVCIAILSGKTGAAIHTIHPPVIKASNGIFWPLDGVFSFYRQPERWTSTLYFSPDHVRRSIVHDQSQSQISWNNGRRTALPSPMQLINLEGQVVAVYHAGMQCRRYNLLTGEEIGSPINVPFMPARRPTLARLGGGKYALVYHEPSAQAHKRANYQQSTHFAAFSLDGTLLWERFVEEVDGSHTTWLSSGADWPLARDVNGDGRDELIVPRHLYGDKLGIRMLDAGKGTDAWKRKRPYQLAGSAEESLDRIELSADIDRDGWREWAVASIAGDPSPEATHQKSMLTGDAFVYIDWISGKTGDSMAWSRHQIPVVSDAIGVVEIDAIRCDVVGSDHGVVEVDVVVGDSVVDDELESMVLRFHPTSPDPIAIAAGMDVCPVQDAGDGPATTRLYHVRGGPFADGAQRLVFLDEPKPQLLRLGESKLIATWEDHRGRKLVAIEGFEPNRLIVVDADTLATVWATERKETVSPEFTPVRRSDGTVDFLVQWDATENEPPTLIDGNTGREKWTMSSPPGGHIITARMMDSDKSMLIVGNGRMRRRGAAGIVTPSFAMSVCSATSGTVRMSQRLLYRAPNHNYPQGFDDLRFVDVNGDGTLDIVGPDQGVAERMLKLAAWDGKTGQQFWSRPLYRDGPQTDYFIPFCILKTDTRPLIAYAGPKSKDSTAASLIICDGETGDLRTSVTLADSQRLNHMDRDYQHNVGAIADCSVAPDQPRVGLHWVGNQAKCHWRLFDVVQDSLRQAKTSDDDSGRQPTIGVLLEDVDDDSVRDRVTARYEQAQTQKGKVIREAQVVLACYAAESDEKTWELRVPHRTSFRKMMVHDQGPAVTAWLEFAEDRFVLVDLARGQVIDSFDGKQSDALPLLTAVVANEESADYQRVVPSRDGIVTRFGSPLSSATAYIATHEQFDPRRQKRLISQGIVLPSFAVMAANGVRSIATLFVFLVMPLWYFGTMLWRRQWSLSWLLMAPPVVLLMLIVGNSQWAHSPDLIFNLLTGMGWSLIISALVLAFWNRGARDHLGGKAWLFLLLGSVAVAMMLLGVHYIHATDADVRYLFSWQDAARLLFFGVCITAQLYWVVLFLKLLRRRIGGKRAQEIAA